MQLGDLDTPALILDRAILQRNLGAMSERMRRLGVALRPHLKTAKSAQVAELATAGGFPGITVSTVAEATYFAGHGFRDITYAFGIVPHKLEPLAGLVQSGTKINLLLDDAANARAVAERAAALACHFDVFVEIDSGGHRAGVVPDDPELVAIGRVLDDSPATALAGVLTHAGQSYHCRGAAAIRRVAEDERLAVVGAAERLRAAGLPCPAVSVGSTPTAVFAECADGVTEMRPGVYVFFDVQQCGIGSCTPADMAVSVLATVIGHNRAEGRIVIDAGALAVSKDDGANEHLPDAGYGWVYDSRARARIGDLRVTGLSQEHGVVAGGDGLPDDAPAIGDRVRVMPNHVCITAACHDRYHVVEDGGDEVVAVWERVNGW